MELWERQKRESEQSFTYYQIYQNEIQKEGEKTYLDVVNYIKTLPKTRTRRDYNSTLIREPTESGLKNLASRWKWKERDVAYKNHLNRLDEEKDEERYQESNDTVKTGLEQDLKDIDTYSKELKKSDYSLSTKINLKYTLARARDLTIKNIRLAHGRSTSISESNDKLKVDAEFNYGGFDKLVEALNDSKKQFLKNKK